MHYIIYIIFPFVLFFASGGIFCHSTGSYSADLYSNPITHQSHVDKNDPAKYWYVLPSGDDSNDGLTEKTALKSLKKVSTLVGPGDTVFLGDGIYTNDEKTDSTPVLKIEKSGTPDAWITWKAIPGNKPIINPSGWAGIEINGSYHVIDGISVLGNNDSITLIAALEDAKNPTPNPYYNSNGILVEGRKNKPTEKPHHVIIRNCTVGKCPGGGITALEADYITIEDCIVFENAWFMRYAGSGITTLNNWAFDDEPGYHIIVQRNKVWNNKTLVPWTVTGKLSDGNGIILDVTDLTPGQGATNPNADAEINQKSKTDDEKPVLRPEWKGRALIANNLSAYNGGSGIHTFRTKHVDIINNTTYWNGQVVNYQELFPNRSEDIVILNNIIVPRPSGKVTSDNKNVDIVWDYNLYPKDQSVFKGENDIVADPFFVDVQLDLDKGDFGIRKNSLGIGSGTEEKFQKSDLIGNIRQKDRGIDRGAVQNTRGVE